MTSLNHPTEIPSGGKDDVQDQQRIVIIGAGPSGMAALRAFAAAEREGAPVPDIVCY